MADEIKKFITILLNIRGHKEVQEEGDKTFKKQHEGVKQATKDAEEGDDKIIKFLGRWKSELMLVGGAVAGIYALVRYSSIANTMTDLLGRSFGLVADLILIRLLPVVLWLTSGLLWLAKAFQGLPDIVKDIIAGLALLVIAFEILSHSAVLQGLYNYLKAMAPLIAVEGQLTGLGYALGFIAGLTIGLVAVYAMWDSGFLAWLSEQGGKLGSWLENAGSATATWFKNGLLDFATFVRNVYHEAEWLSSMWTELLKGNVQGAQDLYKVGPQVEKTAAYEKGPEFQNDENWRDWKNPDYIAKKTTADEWTSPDYLHKKQAETLKAIGIDTTAPMAGAFPGTSGPALDELIAKANTGKTTPGIPPLNATSQAAAATSTPLTAETVMQDSRYQEWLNSTQGGGESFSKWKEKYPTPGRDDTGGLMTKQPDAQVGAKYNFDFSNATVSMDPGKYRDLDDYVNSSVNRAQSMGQKRGNTYG